MTSVIVSAEAEADIEDIVDYLSLNAGNKTASAYAEEFHAAIERMTTFPASGARRPTLGPSTLIAIVSPYLLIYDFEPADDTTILLRVLHEKQNITEQMLKR